MELGRHLEKGFWTIADKGMVAAFGVFMILVVRILPQEAFADYLLIQYTFLILSHLALTLGMAPYVKYYYEVHDRTALQSGALLLMGAFFLGTGAVLGFFRQELAVVLKNDSFSHLFFFVPLLFFAAFGKLFANEIFRTTHEIQKIFWVDFVYYAVNVSFISALIILRRLQTAEILLWINTAAYGSSTLYAFWTARRHIVPAFKLEKGLFVRMLHFGKFAFGSGLSGTIYDRADTFIISALLGRQAVALIGAVKLFLRPFDLYRQAVALLAFPAFSRLHAESRNKDIRSLYEKGIFLSHLALIPGILLLALAADFIFDTILAGKYPAGAFLLRIFVFLGLLISWQAVGEGLLFGIGKAHYCFYSRLAATISSLVLNLSLIYLLGVVGAAMAALTSLGILAILTTYFVRREVGFDLTSILSRYRDVHHFLRRWMR